MSPPVSVPRPATPSVLGMFVAGVQVTARHRWLVVSLYVVQLLVSLVFLVAAQQIFASAFGHRPLFARGVGGDTEALILSMASSPVGSTLTILAIAMAFAYMVLSLYLNAGLIGAFAGRSFGEAAGRWFLPYVRLWLWSLIPYVLCALVIRVGLVMGTSGDSFERLISLKLMFGRPLVFAIPGLLLLTVATCAVDYARVALVVGERRGAARALVGAFRFVFSNPSALAHYGLYVLFWMMITGLYVIATSGHELAGAGGAVVLFALRQLVSLARFGARIATTGGQVALGMQANPK
jgi:hypothetical protein